jgi:hypothetical protein
MIDLVIDFDNQESKQTLFFHLKRCTGKKLIKIASYRKKRSIDQNGYYWGVVLKYLSFEAGYTSEEMHQLLKEKFLAYEKVNQKTGQIDTFTGETKALNTLDFENYLEKVRAFAFDFYDCLIPLPNETI